MALEQRTGGAGALAFPDFVDLGEIGAGRHSLVVRARERETGNLVALKLIDAPITGTFDSVAPTLAAVTAHPNLVTLYRWSVVADGRMMLVLEACERRIAPELASGRMMSAPQAVAVGIAVARALDAAHDAGLVHGDVRPHQILLGAQRVPVLSDLGMALLRPDESAGQFDVSDLHTAPEVLAGGAAVPATDVYALASSVYQLIVGHPPFHLGNGASAAAVIRAALREPAAPLPGRLAPTALSAVLAHAMAKDADDRPSAARFAQQLADAMRPPPRRLTRPPQPAVSPPLPLPPPPLVSPPLPVEPLPVEPLPVEPLPVEPLPVEPLPGPPAEPESPDDADGSLPTGGVPTMPDGAAQTVAEEQTVRAVDAAAFAGDVTLDPSSLRRRTTIRSGSSGLTMDDTKIVVRTYLHKLEIPWSHIRGFEPRFDGDGSTTGWLVALTDDGPVELPATRRPAADLRYVFALLLAYRQRAVGD